MLQEARFVASFTATSKSSQFLATNKDIKEMKQHQKRTSKHYYNSPLPLRLKYVSTRPNNILFLPLVGLSIGRRGKIFGDALFFGFVESNPWLPSTHPVMRINICTAVSVSWMWNAVMLTLHKYSVLFVFPEI